MDTKADDEVERVVHVANAIVASMNSADATTLARGLVAAAAAMAGSDPMACTALALEMVRTALELDPHTERVRWQ